MSLKQVAVTSFACFAAIATAVAPAQNYPSKPIRIVVPGTGGGGDLAARVIGQGLTASWGQQVLVDNRPVGVIPGDVVAKAAPDGYTLLLSGITFWLAPLLQNNVPYDPEKDFLPIGLTVMSPNLMTVHPSIPATSVKEFIAFARSRPGQLNYASGAAGSSNHLSAELFNSMGKVKIVRVNYKNPGMAISDTVAGQVQVVFYNVASVLPYVKAGRLRALAVTSAKRSALAPEFPSVSEAGLPGYESVAMFGVFAPAKTSPAIVTQLNQEIVRYLGRPEVKEKFLGAGAETIPSSPQELAATMRSDIVKIGKVIREAGIRVE
jgi:tripartite-type tricarboxylate transporter receptor subunit TctC